MKIKLETIVTDTNRSFKIILNPKMSDLYFWHFHPEFEIVYIEAKEGIRHVGEHISNFKKNDLVLIGSNIPHLNFDYGIKTPYRKVVAHIKKDFIEKHIKNTAELTSLSKLFQQSKYGIAFKGKIKKEIGLQLFEMDKLKPIEQYFNLLNIFKSLSETNDYTLLHKKPYTNKHSEREQGRIRTIYAFVDKNYHRKIELNEVAALSNMTKEAFCRYFKRVTNYTFIEFLNRYRISHSKKYLMSGKNVSSACFSCGFESLSYFNRTFKKITNENPSEFRKRYL